MNNAFGSAAWTLLLAFSLASPSAAQERVLQREVPVGQIHSLVLNGGNGTTKVNVGDGDTISIRVAVRPEKLTDSNPWRGIKKWFLSSAYEDVSKLIEALQLETDTSAGKLAIGLKPPKRARESRVLEDWQITVPRRFAVRLAMARAETSVTGVTGGVEISIGNGSADVDVPGGDLDIEVTVGKAKVITGSEAVSELSLRSQVGDTQLWMNGMRVKYTDPPGPGSKISMSGKGDDSIRVFVQVGDASLRVNER